jgi:hypothetical protein
MPGHASAHDASADESDREWSRHNSDSMSGDEMRNSLEIQELRRKTRDTFFSRALRFAAADRPLTESNYSEEHSAAQPEPRIRNPDLQKDAENAEAVFSTISAAPVNLDRSRMLRRSLTSPPEIPRSVQHEPRTV